MRAKSKLFELLALKEKLERNKHFKQAKDINEEIQKNNSLKEKLQEITRQEKETNNSITAIQLKSKNWYGLKIQEQILASENKELFLQKENFFTVCLNDDHTILEFSLGNLFFVIKSGGLLLHENIIIH